MIDLEYLTISEQQRLIEKCAGSQCPEDFVRKYWYIKCWESSPVRLIDSKIYMGDS